MMNKRKRRLDCSPSLINSNYDWQMFKTLANALPQIVWTSTPEGKLDYYSEKWFLYSGLTEKQTYDGGWEQVIHPDDLVRCNTKWNHAITNGKSYEIEFRFRCHDGSYRWYLALAIPIKNVAGDIIKWVGTSTDIDDQKRAQITLQNAFKKNEIEIEKHTAEIIRMNMQLKKEILERKQTESKLHNLYEQLQMILDANPHATVATDLQGKVTVFNKAAEKMLGYKASEIIGKHSATLFYDNASIQERANLLSKEFNRKIEPGLQAIIAKLAMQDIDEIDSLVYLRKDGSKIPAQLIITKLKDHDKKVTGYLGVAQDLSEKRKLDKMKGEFISIVSHELRTPLTSIYGTLALLTASGLYHFSNEAKKLLTIASNNSKRLIILVNDILDMEKIEAGKMIFNIEAIEMNQLISEAIMLNQNLCHTHCIKLSFNKQKHAYIVNADRARLHQVLTNLISNAVKFSKPNSEVIIKLTALSNYKIRVCVIDQGKGIPEHFQAMVFHKFSQADASTVRPYEGTGLGLSICKAIIETLGGSINFTSQVNKGTMFFFDLPIFRIID